MYLNTKDVMVQPLLKDKYYVYALCKPDGTPFYIGKGVNSRINDHFKDSNLRVNSPKVGKIKKYGKSIKREILAYFDSEESAYSHEEWLINYYGLESEGGLLTNYAKTRFEYSERFTKDVSSKGFKGRTNSYSDNLIIEAYVLYFTRGFSKSYISQKLNIRKDYLNLYLKGLKHKRLFEEYVDSGLILRNFKYRAEKTRVKNYSIFRTKKELHERKLLSRKEQNVKTVEFFRDMGLSYDNIASIVGMSKSNVSRIINKIDGYEKGSGNGTSDKVSEKDNSANNLSNK